MLGRRSSASASTRTALSMCCARVAGALAGRGAHGLEVAADADLEPGQLGPQQRLDPVEAAAERALDRVEATAELTDVGPQLLDRLAAGRAGSLLGDALGQSVELPRDALQHLGARADGADHALQPLLELGERGVVVPYVLVEPPPQVVAGHRTAPRPAPGRAPRVPRSGATDLPLLVDLVVHGAGQQGLHPLADLPARGRGQRQVVIQNEPPVRAVP
jgi:hypothetical protein